MALNEDVKIFAKEVDGQTQTQIKIKNDNSKVYLKLDPDSEAQWILLEPIISSFKANKVPISKSNAYQIIFQNNFTNRFN